MSEENIVHPPLAEPEKQPAKKQSQNNRENITRFLPFVLFLSGLLLVYIFLTHRTDRKIRKTEKLSKEVKELYSEFITLQTEILNAGRSTNLESKMLKYGIKPATEPPKIIK